MAERGLKLSETKTRIVHVDDGFDFLGFTVRRYRGVVLTRPQKAKLVNVSAPSATICATSAGHREADNRRPQPIDPGLGELLSARRIQARVPLDGPPCQRQAAAVGETTTSHQDGGVASVEIL